MVLYDLSPISLVNNYKPDMKHFDHTWKDPNGTTITEKGFLTEKEAWSPGSLVALYIFFALILSTCVVYGVLCCMYNGDLRAAFDNGESNDNDYNVDQENNNRYQYQPEP